MKELYIYLGIMAICFLTQTGFEFAKSNGYTRTYTVEDYKFMAYTNLLFGIWTLSLLTRIKI